MSDRIKSMSLDSYLDGASARNYKIKNKDRTIGTFQWDDDDTGVLVDDYGLPTFIYEDFNDWLGSRTPPKHRTHMKELLEQLGLSTLKSVIDFSKGLSLTDSFWIVHESDTIAWKNVSLFNNAFDDVIARVAFDGGLHGIPLSTTTPELGTNGMLAKCWVRNSNGGIDLLKTGTTGASNAGNEPYSENLAHQVLERLCYNHVPYSVENFHGRLVSRCPLFTSEEMMFLPIYRYYSFRSLDRLVKLCKQDNIHKGLAQHLVYDYLSWNTDRHAGNLGVLLDSSDYKLIDFAPIFDNGVSMLNYWNGTDDIDEYTTRSTPALYQSFEQGAKVGKKILGNSHNVQRLIGFKFDRSQVPGYSEQRIDAIENWLQRRVKKFLEF